MDRWVKYLDEDDREHEFLLPRTLPLSEVEILGKQNRHLLISGESGTGRSALALLIWNKSPRFDKRFTPTDADGKRLVHIVNCTHRKDELVTSELFGTEKVAHTGDTRDRPGILRILAGGTLVAKELGHLGGDVQTKLLRFLNDGKLLKLGSDYLEERIDVRVIATNTADANSQENVRTDLAAAFLQPLITLPPLRKRIEDIPTLIAKFMEPDEYYVGISIDWLVGMMKAEWKGNIQNLKNYCEAMTGRGSTLTQEVISGQKPLNPQSRIIYGSTLPHSVKEWEFDTGPFMHPDQNVNASHITYYHIVNNLLQNLEATGSDLEGRARECASLRNSLIILNRMALIHCSALPYIYVLFSSIRKGTILCQRIIFCEDGLCLSSDECSLGEFIADIFKWARDISNMPDADDDTRAYKANIYDSVEVSDAIGELEASLPRLDGPVPKEISAKVVTPIVPVQQHSPKLNPPDLSTTPKLSDMNSKSGTSVPNSKSVSPPPFSTACKFSFDHSDGSLLIIVHDAKRQTRHIFKDTKLFNFFLCLAAASKNSNGGLVPYAHLKQALMSPGRLELSGAMAINQSKPRNLTSTELPRFQDEVELLRRLLSKYNISWKGIFLNLNKKGYALTGNVNVVKGISLGFAKPTNFNFDRDKRFSQNARPTSLDSTSEDDHEDGGGSSQWDQMVDDNT